jgi:hypothetical protein
MYNIQHLVALPSDRHPREGSSGPSSLFRLNPRFGTPALAKATVWKFLKKEHSMSDSEYMCMCVCVYVCMCVCVYVCICVNVEVAVAAVGLAVAGAS